MRSLLIISLLIFTATLQAQSNFDKQVDQLLRVLGTRETRQQGIDGLRTLGKNAEGRLLFHVKNRTRVWSLMSIDAFQYVWTDKIKEMCKTTIQSKDQNIATMTMAALMKNLSTRDLVLFCDPILHKMNPVCANPIFVFIQNQNQSKERLEKVITNRAMWPAAAPFLCKFRGEKINKMTRTLLGKGNEIVKREAINALIFQSDNDPKVRQYILKCLKAKDDDLRERAAEYFRWYGTSDELNSLKESAKKERDLYAKASMDAAIEAIENRKKVFSQQAAEEVEFTQRGKDLYKEIIFSLSDSKTKKSLNAAVKSIHAQNEEDPRYQYGSGVPVDQELTRAQLTAFRLIAGYKPLAEIQSKEKLIEVQTPRTFYTVPPIPEYFDPRRKSFGKLIPPNGGPFADSYHVGDDCAWLLNLTPVVSISDGIVRYATHTVSWGCIVIIEHKDADGNAFCSLYGHLDPLVCVKPGQLVKAGEKIGSLGRSHTWENGGYGSHLHFGIHQSEFKHEWICGYISKSRFNQRRHKWTDPQEFIKKNMLTNHPMKIRLEFKKKQPL